MSQKTRDAVLLLIAAAILVIALLPSSPAENETEEAEVADGIAKRSKTRYAPAPKPVKPKENPVDEPVDNIPHPLFPLIVGSKWIYTVQGPAELVPNNQWTMEITAMPTENNLGLLSIGFGRERSVAHFWLDDGALRFDGLPFTAPQEYRDLEPIRVAGQFLSPSDAIGQGATWHQELIYDIIHQFRDELGEVKKTPAEGRQRDRAMVEELNDTVIVPAGSFKAHRLYWLSRFKLKAKVRRMRGKKIFDKLTDEPYRKELMWLAPGVGIVQRSIEFPKTRSGKISFMLLSYTRP